MSQLERKENGVNAVQLHRGYSVFLKPPGGNGKPKKGLFRRPLAWFLGAFVTNTWAMSSDHLTAHRQFEMDLRPENVETLVEAKKKVSEEDAQQELHEKMGNTLADFQTWPAWTVEDAEAPDIRIYKLTMKVVFKP
jgi:hypothetical protein